jgi:putative lipoprotein
MRRSLLAPVAAAALIAGAAPARAAPPDPDPWFGRDKGLHFAMSSLITGASYGGAAIASPDLRVRIAFGAGIGLAAGVAKELFDLAGLGHPSWKDLTWDIVGVAVGLGVSVTLDLAIRGPHPAAASAR